MMIFIKNWQLPMPVFMKVYPTIIYTEILSGRIKKLMIASGTTRITCRIKKN